MVDGYLKKTFAWSAMCLVAWLLSKNKRNKKLQGMDRTTGILLEFALEYQKLAIEFFSAKA